MNVITLTLSHTVHVISFSISLKNTLLCVSKIVSKSYFKLWERIWYQHKIRHKQFTACLHSMPGSYKDIKIYLSIFLTIQVLKKKYTLARLYLDNYIKEFNYLSHVSWSVMQNWKKKYHVRWSLLQMKFRKESSRILNHAAKSCQ